MKRRSVRPWAFVLLFVSALLGSCGGPLPPPPKADAPLVVGSGGPPVTPPPRPIEAPEDDATIPIMGDDAVRGSRLAPVTIVVFSDLECPFCARLDVTFDQLREEYGDEKLRIVFKNNPLPFHRNARLAAEVGQGVLAIAGQEAFWRYQTMAFRGRDVMSPEAIRAWAVRAGADGSALDEGLASQRWSAKVDRDMELARRLHARGTPTSFINGVLVTGAQPLEKFKEVIESELAQARSLVERGVPPDQVYTRLVAANFEPPSDVESEAVAVDAATAREVHKIPVGTAPVRGPATAHVTIVMFSDFECPFCKRAEETVARIRREYGDKVRVVWRDMPLSFHDRAEPAAQLARAARAQKGDAGFWAVHDLLFDSQPNLTDADLERIAREAKLDVAKAMAAVRSKAFKRGIDDDVVVADDFQVSGTPHFFVNGRRVVGSKPFDTFKSLIDEEIAKAEALLRGGASRKDLYDLLVKDGKTPPEPVKKSIAAAAPNAPFRGAPNAKVVIQEVGDFQCPFCKRADAMMTELLKAYPGKIKVIWRDKPLPIHPDAELAAEAAREAFAQKGSAGFEKMAKALFDHPQALKRDDLDGYARSIGLDMTRFARALDERTHKAAVAADVRATTDAAINGTPAFFVGPYYVSGAAPYAKFRKLVELTLSTKPAAVAAPAEKPKADPR